MYYKKTLVALTIILGLLITMSTAKASECDSLKVSDLQGLQDVKKTRMKAKHGLYTSFWRLEIKSKECKKWTTVYPLDMRIMFEGKEIADEYWVAFFEIAKVEQAIRDQHNLGPRKIRLQEKAHNSVEWMEKKKNDGSLIGILLDRPYNPPTCVTAGGTTYCVWGAETNNIMVTSN